MNTTRPEGVLNLRPRIATVADVLAHAAPEPGEIGERAAWQRANRVHLRRSLADQARFERGAMRNRLGVIGHLWLAKVIGDDRLDLGLASCRVVTNVGVAYIVDAFQNLVELENMKFHGVGTGTNAENANNTALASELTTQYSASNTRATGTLGEQGGSANIFETMATITVSASVAITEHGLFSTAATGSGVLLDRSVFAPVNLAGGESLQATYSLTFPSGN